MKSLVQETQRAWEAYGKISYGPTKAEKKSVKYRRSLYISKDIKMGEVLTKDNLKAVRPGFGLETKFMDSILGKQVVRDLSAGTPMSWDLIKD